MPRSTASHSATLLNAMLDSGSPASASVPQVTTTASGSKRVASGNTASSIRKDSSLSLNPAGTGRLRA